MFLHDAGNMFHVFTQSLGATRGQRGHRTARLSFSGKSTSEDANKEQMREIFNGHGKRERKR
eukprot:1393176-Amorphochlora_amoeboformis.AAC.2